MNIEGTKHEKAVLVLLAYTIGLTSGFIAFGIAQPNSQIIEDVTLVNNISVSHAEVQQNEQTEMTLSNTDESSEAAIEGTTQTPTGKGTEVYYENDRLYVSVDGETNLLSAARSSLSSAVAAAFSTQGTHVTIPKFLTSPGGAFVYFCEQQQEVDSCVSFVYDVSNNVIQYVSDNGKKVTVPATVAKSAAWNENTLSFGSYRSQSVEKPWVVTTE